MLHPAGSRPGWRVTFLFDDKKVTKETSFELCDTSQQLKQARRCASPVRLEQLAPGDRSRFSNGAAQQTDV